MFFHASTSFALAALVTSPSLAAAQEDAYLSCPEEVACYTSDGCHPARAGALFFTIYEGGQRVVIESLDNRSMSLRASEKNVYRVPLDEGLWMIVLSDDWSRYYMIQAFPQMQDAAAITGLCERRPH